MILESTRLDLEYLDDLSMHLKNVYTNVQNTSEHATDSKEPAAKQEPWSVDATT